MLDSAFVASEELGRGLVLGGANATQDFVLTVTVNNFSWSSLPSTLGLAGHCVALDPAGRVRVFGGLPASANKAGLLWFPLLDYPNNVSSATDSDAPSQLDAMRHGAACAMLDADTLLVHGGAADAQPSTPCVASTLLATLSENGTVAWTLLDDAASVPPPRRGATLVALDPDSHTLLLVGGVLCAGNHSSEGPVSPVWRFDTLTREWRADPFDPQGPFGYLAGLHDAGVQVVGDTLFVYGGIVASNLQSSLLAYDLTQHTWRDLSNLTLGVLTAPRLVAASPTRALLLGETQNKSTVLGALVNVAYCAKHSSCTDCVTFEGCLFAQSSQSECLPGARGVPYLPPLHNVTQIVDDNTQCPMPRAVPSWLVPVVIVVLVVIVLVVIGSYYLDTRKSRQRAGYQGLDS